MPRAVLMGPPGSGKSSIGKALAKELGTTFIDTDSLIENLTNKTITEIFNDSGEEVFREIEQEVVLGVLASEPGIVALGGGSILSEQVREQLSKTSFPVVYLHVSPHQALARVGKQNNRPLLTDNPEEKWLQILAQREPIYQALADMTFSTDSKKANEIAVQIAHKCLEFGVGR